MPNGSTLPRQERGAIVQQIDVEQDCLSSNASFGHYRTLEKLLDSCSSIFLGD